MGLDVVFECEDHIQAGPRPKHAHSSDHRRAKVDERDIKGLLRSKYHNLRMLDGDSRELRRSNTTSPHRKSMPARSHVVYAKDSEVVRRGSVYQSSKEERRMRQLNEERRNGESDLSNEAFLSFEIVDSLPQRLASKSTRLPKQKRSPNASLNPESTSQSVDDVNLLRTKSTDFLELSFRDVRQEGLKLSIPCSDPARPRDSIKCSQEEICLNTNEIGEKGSIEAHNSGGNQNICTKANANNVLSGRETMYNLPKSFSAKAVMFNSTCQSERETLKAGPKSRFAPFKRMLDPIMKSKFQRNPSPGEAETVRNTVVDSSSIGSHRVFCRSLINDFSKVTQKGENDSRSRGRDQVSVTGSSRAHLHAILKLESKHGAPSYEFAVDNPEDILSAMTWRSANAFSWVYTFHRSNKKATSTSGRLSKERHGQSPPIIGQMQVSCYICSEVRETRSMDNSTVTEFIMYDLAQARRSFAFEEGPCCPSDSTLPATFTIADSLAMESPLEVKNSVLRKKCQHNGRRPSSDFDSDPSTSYPLAPADLHPHLQIAAIVVQIPLNKKEMKGRPAGKQIRDKEQTRLSSASTTDQGIAETADCTSPAHVKVITPSGTHGSPSTEESSPASLLDRWRLGGGCDCGGWDMACPIAVFENPYANDAEDESLLRGQQPIVLFIQGRKEKIPALSIVADGKGQFSVNFDAQLSALQAFSICVAILHSSEAAWALGHENRQRLYSSSLKLLLGEEVRHLIEAVEEEKRKAKNRGEQVPPSFVLDPPFSPIGRV